MDERQMEQVMLEIHDFVTKDADQRDKEAEKRHKELLNAIDDSRKAIVTAIENGFRAVADALRHR
jgi:hypothetical protein